MSRSPTPIVTRYALGLELIGLDFCHFGGSTEAAFSFSEADTRGQRRQQDGMEKVLHDRGAWGRRTHLEGRRAVR